MGTAAIAALHQALGAAVAAAPMVGTTLATSLVCQAGSESQKAALLPGLANGSIRVGMATPQNADVAFDGTVINGFVPELLDAPSATMLFLRGTQAGAPVWLAIPAQAPGVSVKRYSITDSSRSMGAVTLSGVALADVTVLGLEDARKVEDELLRIAALVLAADAQGGGQAVLAVTIEYMKVREQFGRVIGSFQALKHRVADHKCALEAAAELIEHAAGLDADAPGALLAALTAKQHITRISAEIARDCIQLHGGVGFTSDYVPHLYLKRGKLNEALFGTRSMLLDRIADLLEAA
jgi:alkylation response protein AidB-like acyl-CoA dehydrogenase